AAGVTKIEVAESGKSIDSNGPYVSFSGSRVKIAWGKLGVEAVTSPTIYAYSPTHPDGEVIVGPGKAEHISLSVMLDERPSI
ncbi:MAG: hypothetical protein AAFN66_10770, partial [Pseudomonadota bacterium]